MAKINVLAGDFLQGDGDYRADTLTLITPLHPWPGISFRRSDIQSMEVASQGHNKNIEGALGLGLAGALMLGPVGAAAGLMLAGEEKEVTFLATLKDGRKLLAATDDKTYRRMNQPFEASPASGDF
ncbi:hypothetical protein RRX38_04710 [Pseudomonas sp. DTU_2021_1001937_2_SI_NGA_ILE_001]|uniref:hypothetical protein n=1 Tax=Pseudomonas sp. DTU_2021_1001937_2_SI_NGA_ILE_001 TaxID=3077589 RepID=UPI0025D8B855|nr:hypothetical protein [Pseudomonas sp. DTU_2021_1001937_2_SI_NGA_ILE_001]WNW10481.1 hypothetical protein RRX38_04710 [Pseudomonas sp. DTU_2021_1001937_2_SI_NGA_ILE_001]